jgi:hypothetical protein
MACNHPFPKPALIQQIIKDLLGREVSVVKGAPQVIERDTPVAVADYVADGGVVGAVIITDLYLSNAMGAALTMVPMSAVETAVQKWQLEEANMENLSEIINIMARIFNHDDFDHMRWSKTHPQPGPLPEETAALVKAPLARRDYDVTIEEYGTGKLAVLVG